MIFIRGRGIFLAMMMLLICDTITAQVFPTGFSQVPVATGINNPTVLAFAPDGRIFICEQAGKIHVYKNNALLATSFLQLTVNSTGERGLIGIAFDPDFNTNQYLYVYYTVPTAPIHNRISRFTANGDVVVSGSETIILELDNLSSATNHNGGAMHFGKDGKLYVAIGENANGSNAQNLDTYHGKLLRINKDGSVPDGNPFATGSEQRKRVWSYGLRNPYTFSIQEGTGRIFINDVGQVTWEEINEATEGGLNFGWPTAEGVSTNPAFVNPLYTYQHGSGDGKGCAITGGTFFNPQQTDYPGVYYGKYFFQDLCNQWINYIDYSAGTGVRSPFATGLPGTALGLTVGPDGNLYYLSRATKILYKVIYNNATAPFITVQPAPVTATEEESASFSVQAIGTGTLLYQWQKDGVDILGATSSTYAIPNVEPTDEGVYRVIVTNDEGTAQSNEAQLTVVNVNDLPMVEITSPEVGNTYVAGTTINFSGIATDEEDGELPPSAFSWVINFHHDDHVHDQPSIDGVTEGTFDIPDEGETSANVWYEFVLTVTDSDGLSSQASVEIHPETSTISLATDPPGLQLTLDDQPFDTPGSVLSVEGIKRTIGVITPQELDGTSYYFVGWQHEGDASQTIITPEDDVTYTALYSVVLGEEDDPMQRAFTLLPNPVGIEDREVAVKIFSPYIQNANVYVVDMLSRQLNEIDIRLEAGENTVPINVEKLKNGVYGVMLKTNNQKMMRRMLISR